MKKFTKACLGVGAVAAVAGVSALVAFAWGPSRTTYTMEKPADKVTFNSITNNFGEIGDERYFVSATEYKEGDNKKKIWTDTTFVEEGKEYTVRVYVHNDAASNLKLVAKNTRAHVSLPSEKAKNIMVQAMVSADNAEPNAVWDQTNFKSKNGEEFSLSYVPGTAKFTNRKQDGTLRTFDLDAVQPYLFSEEGMHIGYDKMDGNFPGCIEYSGYLTFNLKPTFNEKAKLKISKQVRVNDNKDWREIVTAKSGDTVEYRIEVKNTGNATIQDVTFRDILPEGLTLVPGSIEFYNANYKDGTILSDDAVLGKGVSIGGYSAGSNAWIYIKATVNEGLSDRCMPTTLHNVAQADGGFGVVKDSADVIVSGKSCKEDKPNFTIEKKVQNKDGKKWEEKVTAEAGKQVRYRIQFKNTGNVKLENVVIKDVLPEGVKYVEGSTKLYNLANLNGKTMSDDIVSEQGLNIGNYLPLEEANIYFYATVDESFKDKCEESTLTNVVSGKYNNDDSTIKKDTADVVVPAAQCVEPEPKPEPKPEEPDELPKTGANSIMMRFVGLASIVTASAYYVTSRKQN